MKTKKRTNQNRRTTRRTSNPADTAKLQFIEHVQELRRRFYYIAASVLVWGAATYAVQQHVVNVLLKPARGENFIYTSPGGGIDFLFRICVYTGVIFSLPVIVYNTLRFIEPLIAKASLRFIMLGSFVSGLLALAGIIFGYYLGLPAALHFLLHQFTTAQIRPLVTIQSYLGFVIVYMAGSALLFQVPLVLILVNRIKPLKPRRLLHYERWVILVAFVLAGLMNPTPNVFSQLLVAGPFILMYQVGILLIALINRKHKPGTVELLYQTDLQAQANRHSLASSLQPLPSEQLINLESPGEASPQPAVKPVQPRAQTRPAVQTHAVGPRRSRSPQQVYATRRQQPRTFNDMRLTFSERRPAIDNLRRGVI